METGYTSIIGVCYSAAVLFVHKMNADITRQEKDIDRFDSPETRFLDELAGWMLRLMESGELSNQQSL